MKESSSYDMKEFSFNAYIRHDIYTVSLYYKVTIIVIVIIGSTFQICIVIN